MKKYLNEFRLFFFLLFLFQIPFLSCSQSSLPTQKAVEEKVVSEQIKPKKIVTKENGTSLSEVNSLFKELGSYNKMVIKTNLDSLLLNKKTGADQEASVMFYGEDQPVLKFNIKVKARGKFRRVKCDFPPLKLNFSKKELTEKGLYRKFDKLKLVTHCSNDENTVDQVVLKEYWTYKMYNELSEHSFDVNLFSIIYQHDKDSSRKIEGTGFFIEPEVEMAARHGAELVDTLGRKSTHITPDSYHHSLLFNYMVGNTDWNITLQKNMVFIKFKEESLLTMIPYDFDNCKLVDAPYMSLYPDAKSVKMDNRYVKEKFLDKESLIKELATFQELKDTGFYCFEKCEVLSRNEKLKMKSYLKTFFKRAKKQKLMNKLFIE